MSQHVCVKTESRRSIEARLFQRCRLTLALLFCHLHVSVHESEESINRPAEQQLDNTITNISAKLCVINA